MNSPAPLIFGLVYLLLMADYWYFSLFLHVSSPVCVSIPTEGSYMHTCILDLFGHYHLKSDEPLFRLYKILVFTDAVLVFCFPGLRRLPR